MEVPITIAEPQLCFNIQVASCEKLVESNVSISQHSHNPTCDKHLNQRTQTKMKKDVMYDFHGQLIPEPGGEELVAGETITSGSRESGETSKNGCYHIKLV